MLIDELKKRRIYLVSQSPRRKELLSGMGIDFEILKTEVAETYDVTLSPEKVVMQLSALKLSPIDILNEDSDKIFIASDTIVVNNGKIIGKPKNREEAFEMLRSLSGNTHTVYSGLTVATSRKIITDFRATEVVFEKLSDEVINYYIDTYKPYDKAGSYGVQEWIGYVGISEIRGSFYNVMGLPTRLLWEMLQKICEI